MLTKADLAKYPFLSEASEYVRELGLSIEELSAPEFSPVLDRAEGRLEEALSKGRVSGNITNENAEILSFPVSNLILSLVGEERARRRFALAESKRAYELLRQEEPEKLEYIASTTFMWKLKRLDVKLGKRFYDFALSLPNFLHNSVHLREPRWNLPNRVLDHGFVYITRDEAARLIEEEVRAKILERSGRTPDEVPKLLGSRVERARGLVVKWLGVPTKYELPKVPLPEAMPPCVRHLIDSLDEGKNVQHMGRFTSLLPSQYRNRRRRRCQIVQAGNGLFRENDSLPGRTHRRKTGRPDQIYLSYVHHTKDPRCLLQTR